eukprot:1581917-Heterocapsa_arctica.AAC.1
MAALAEKQHKLEGWFSIENPQESYLWDFKEYKRLLQLPGVKLVYLHQCAYGGPFRKGTGILTNAPWIIDNALLCENAAPHKHVALVGR